MTSAATEPDGGLLGAYRARLRARGGPTLDEVLAEVGVHEQSLGLVDAMEGLGLGGLRAAQAEARRFVRDDGIRFGASAPGRLPRRWDVDPLPVVLTAQEWAAVDRGLEQRARLLDLVLRDAYGPRELLRRGVIPPEVVFGHPGFVHQVDGLTDDRQSRLVLTATDLGRGDDGAWTVMADRSETPAGAGYAMASRRITTRVMAGLHRDTGLLRLRGFFHTMTRALQRATVTGAEPPRIVLLSEGERSDTAFEQAFIATLCGFPVVESEDLVVREGRVWIETSERPEPVDVVLRRVDTLSADPLELRAGSEVGVPGLVEAVRRGTVTVVNPMGAGLLDNPALLPFLPGAARALLGEDLLLPQAQTWWCGTPDGLSHVLARLDSLVVKPIGVPGRARSRFGWRLDEASRDDLRREIEARPWAWCGQEPLALSTAPVVTASGLEPRPFVLRTFAVTADEATQVLPGGLGRVAPRDGDPHISSGNGALAKDVWVLATPGVADSSPADGAGDATRRPLATRTTPAPRVAENLYWVGRYAERVEGTARILRVTADLVEDHGNRPDTPGGQAMTALVRAVGELTRIPPPDADADAAALRDHLRMVVVEQSVEGTVAYAASRLIQSAQQVRDQMSGDAWMVLSRLERTLGEAPDEDVQLQPQLANVLESMLAVAGIIVESMVRDAAWGFIDMGTRLERAVHTLSLVRHTLAVPRSPVADGQVTEAVLTAGESILTHRRRLVTGEGHSSPILSAVDLLLVDPGNPRSVAFQLDRLVRDLALVGDRGLVEQAGELRSRLGSLDVEAVCAGDRVDLAETCVSLRSEVRRLASTVARSHFSRRAPQRPLESSWGQTQGRLS